MRGALLLATLLLATPALGATTTSAEAVGPVPVGCGACHLDRAPAAGEGALDFRSLRQDGAGDGAICQSCHNGVVRDSRRAMAGFQHPVGVRVADPDGRARAGLPTDPLGRISCGTCHTPHQRAEGTGFFMRFPAGSGDYCRRCHPGRGVGTGRGDHPMGALGGREDRAPDIRVPDTRARAVSCPSCHRVHAAPQKRLLRANPAGPNGLCRSCHGVGRAETPPERRATVSHPLDRGGGGNGDAGSAGFAAGRPVDCWGCHRTHGGRSPGLLVDELAEGTGCRLCHESQTSVVRQRRNHPVSLPEAGREPGGRTWTTCRHCHRVHGGAAGTKLLAFNPGANDFCAACHGDKFFTGANHPLGKPLQGSVPGALAAAGSRFGPSTAILCLSCHSMHAAERDTPGLVTPARILCLRCHARQNSLDSRSAPPGAHPLFTGRTGLPGERPGKGGEGAARGDDLECAFCHRVHGVSRGTDHLLAEARLARCTTCHAAGPGPVHPSPKREGAPTPGERPAEEACATCHRFHGWAVTFEDRTEDAVSSLCLSCHGQGGSGAPAASEGFNHPLGGTVEAMDPTAGLPLFTADGRRFRKGRTSCATCHDVHGGGGAGRALLRRPLQGGDHLCRPCHRDKDLVTGTRHDLTRSHADEINLAGRTAAEGGVCSPCHQAHGGFDRFAWARLTDGRGHPDVQRCASCHDEGLVGKKSVTGPFAHPMSQGELDLEGKQDARTVTCRTCHDPHRWNPRDPRDRGRPDQPAGPATSFLRQGSDRESLVCRRCHPLQGGMAGGRHDVPATGGEPGCTPPGGGSLCGTCHSVHRGSGPFGVTVKGGAGRDAVSATCLTCHGEEGCASAKAIGPSSHPVSVQGKAAPGSGLILLDARGLPGDSGLISCVTCHDPHARTGGAAGGGGGRGGANLLRLPVAGVSPLCIACHREEALVAGTDHDLRITAPESVNGPGKGPAESGLCGACHGVHNIRSAYLLWNRPVGPALDAATSLCTGCHRDQGTGRRPPRAGAHLATGEEPGELQNRREFITRKGSGGSGASLRVFSDAGTEVGRGYVTCLTCHGAHRWDADLERPGPGEPQDGDAGNSFLRVKGSFAIQNSFCNDCHRYDVVEKFRAFHQPRK